MLLTISGVLTQDMLQAARKDMDALSWRDGTETAGGIARRVKRNEQADLKTGTGPKVKARFEKAIQNHPVFLSAARPKAMSPLIVSKTSAEGGYGLHIDNAHMGKGAQRIRTDLSFTLFVSEPDEYEGGELVIEHPGATEMLKPAAGDLVLYPSTTMHKVATVTSGVRLACVGWVESDFRDERQREVIFDLENLKASVQAKFSPESPEVLTLQKTMANLTRMWSGI